MKIVYFGSDVFLSCFEYLAGGHEILALYTYHNEEDYFTEYAIARRAKELGIPVHYDQITPEEITQYVQGGCGLFFIGEYSHILQLPRDLAGFRGINVHSSLLPQGRSYYPLEGAMERELETTGVTLHKVARRLDGGDILAQRAFPITPDTDSVDLYLRCAGAAREMLEEIMADLDAAWEHGRPQPQTPDYWRRPDTALLTLDHSMTRARGGELFRRYNSLTQVKLGGAWYYVRALDGGSAPLGTEEREIGRGRWLYRVADGHLRLCVIPCPGKEMES